MTKGFKRMISRMSLFYKFFYGIVLIVLVVLIFSSVTSYIYTRHIFIDQAIDAATRLVDNINEGFEANLEQVDRIIMSIYSDVDYNNSRTSLRQALSPEPFRDVTEQHRAYLAVDSFFQRLLYLRGDFNSVYIYVTPEKQYSYTVFGTTKWPYDPTKEEWFQKTIAANGSTVIFGPHLPFQLNYSKEVISFSRALKGISTTSNKVDGVILIDLSLETLSNIIAKANLSETTDVVLLDENNRVIYADLNSSPAVNFDHAQIIKMEQQRSGSFSAVIGGTKYLVAYSTLEVNGWKSVTLTPFSELNKSGKRLLVMHLLLAIAALFLTVLIAYLFSKKIFRPIQVFKKGFSRVKQGDFNVKLELSSHDEFGQLVSSFNSMVEQIRNLIVENYAAQLARKNAEFNYLQSQINPHFLYNTLQIVSGMAAVHKVPDIGMVTKNLAKMLRYSINNHANIVPIKSEIENIICYLDIQKIRYRSYFDYDLNISEEVYRYSIVKLLLQPIVENSVIHGLEAKESGRRLRISARMEGSDIIFEVYDNGVGMSQEETLNLKALIEGIEQSDKETKSGFAGGKNSIGLRNIQERIRMFYGPDYGLSIDSKQGEWTRVVVRIPAKKEGEN